MRNRFPTSRLSAHAGTLLYSVTYDAVSLGASGASPADVSEHYGYLNESCRRLAEYVGKLEAQLGITQEMLHRFR